MLSSRRSWHDNRGKIDIGVEAYLFLSVDTNPEFYRKTASRWIGEIQASPLGCIHGTMIKALSIAAVVLDILGTTTSHNTGILLGICLPALAIADLQK